MRDIPASLLDKIKQTYQTIHGNAEPRLDIFVGREGDYLSALEKFFVITIQDGQTLNRIDVATARPDPYHLPTELTVVYLVDDDAYVATTPLPVHPKSKWTIQEALGKGIDVSIEFEGYWVRRERAKENFEDPRKSRFSLVTVGEPWCFVTRPDGSLQGKHGSGSWTTLVPEGVTRIDAIGGWKGLRVPHDDQGLVLAYIKNGVVCYRNRATQEDLSIVWEAERVVAELPIGVDNLSLFRTNDYRIGFLVEVAGEIHWALTARTWSGMAVDDHHLSASIGGVTLDLIPIVYSQGHHEHSMLAAIGGVTLGLCPVVDMTVVANPVFPGEDTLTLAFSDPIVGDGTGLGDAFTVTDGNSATWPVVSTGIGNSQSHLLLTFDSLAGAAVELNVSFRADRSGVFKGFLLLDRSPTCQQQVWEFDVAAEVKQPEGFHVHTITPTIRPSIILTEVMYPSVYQGDAQQHKVAASIGGVSFTLTYYDPGDPPTPVDP